MLSICWPYDSDRQMFALAANMNRLSSVMYCGLETDAEMKSSIACSIAKCTLITARTSALYFSTRSNIAFRLDSRRGSSVFMASSLRFAYLAGRLFQHRNRTQTDICARSTISRHITEQDS